MLRGVGKKGIVFVHRIFQNILKSETIFVLQGVLKKGSFVYRILKSNTNLEKWKDFHISYFVGTSLENGKKGSFTVFQNTRILENEKIFVSRGVRRV